VFCRLLDASAGGYLHVRAAAGGSVERRYRGPTNVLETTFTTDTGAVRLTDCMPVHPRPTDGSGCDVDSSHQILRRLEGVQGTLDVTIDFKPTFDYASAHAELSVTAGRAVARLAGHPQPDALSLECPSVELRIDGSVVRGRLRVQAGDEHWIVLTEGPAAGRAGPADWATQLRTSIEYWEAWAARCSYHGPYRDLVVRSALALKLMTYEPTGAIVAAPTTSLPELIGGERNWDYRFAWLRDSAFIVDSLISVGYEGEAFDFMRWLEHTVVSDPTPNPQIMYGIRGERDLTERTLNLDGYRGSRPVRVGNAAYQQTQVDIYGEVLMAAQLHYRDARGAGSTHRRSHPSAEAWKVLTSLVEDAARCWTVPGSGIWEQRGPPQDFVYGKLMCWAALDRGVRLALEHELEAPLERWQATRDQIRQVILDHGYSEQVGAFIQAFGSHTLDASALDIPRFGFLPATDPRVQSTIDAIRRDLTRQGLVYRYRTADGLAGGEGTFILCTFWLVDALALGGRVDEARALFEQVVGYANDVGLLSEEIDPDARELLGNFPQGFSHLAVIRSAVNLARAAGS
jgi:GH15 family glucan-1,4-alpha-glucosidase